MIKWIAAMSLFSGLFGTNVGLEPITADEFQQRLHRHKIFPILIDIRSPHDFEKFHLAYSVNMPAALFTDWKSLYQGLSQKPLADWTIFIVGYNDKQVVSFMDSLSTCHLFGKYTCPKYAYYLHGNVQVLDKK